MRATSKPPAKLLRKWCLAAFLPLLAATPVLAGVEGGAEPGLWLEHLRDAAILARGEHYLHARFDYSALHIPVSGHSVTDKEHTLRTRLFFAYGLLGDRVDFGAAVDIYGRWYRPGEESGRLDPPSSYSTGDIGDSRLGIRFALPAPGPLDANIETFVSMATGDRKKEFTSKTTDAGAIVALGLRKRSYRLHLHAGYRLNRNESEGVFLYPLFYPNVAEGKDDTSNDALLLRAGVEFSAPGVDLYVELLADQLLWVRDSVSPRENPIQLIPGLRVRLRRGWYISGSLGVSLASSGPDGEVLHGTDLPVEIAYPDWNASLGLHVLGTIGGEDRDDDGVEDAFDRCPDASEDYDGFEDDDGCPDVDNDGDGILDDWDKAPGEAEDFDGFEDGDGAPEWDNDEDGIPDVEDFCPDDPEDIDGDRDHDGCPDIDEGKAEESG